ncbi:MAG: hypothetical protein K6T86_09630 [Pirellulales bacterium]|nr:hypothetical protein [Pirellulales bacterium]
MSNIPQATQQNDVPPVTLPPQDFWTLYSPRGEFPLSSTASIVLHLLAVLLIILIGRLVLTKPAEQPAVDVLHVGPELTAAPDEGAREGPQSEESLEAAEQPSQEAAAETMPIEELVQVDERPESQVEVPDTAGQMQKATRKAQEGSQAAKRARERLEAAKNRLNENLGSVGGGGGSGPTGRAARVARWIMRFDVSSVRDYLAQMDGLGAQIAFPDRGDKFLYFSNLASPTPKKELKDISNETRIYWVDENPQSVAMVCQYLGVPDNGFFLAFLPRELEERLLRMELAYMNLAEEDILSTTFRVIRRGGGYDVQVESQIPK